MPFRLIPGAIYRHYRNPNVYYIIESISKHHKTLEDYVVYRATYFPIYMAMQSPKIKPCQVWIRPKNNFLECLHSKEINGIQKPIYRFTFIDYSFPNPVIDD